MGFGFATEKEEDDGKLKELEHKVSDRVRWQRWDDLKVGDKVQSVITHVKGHISDLDHQFQQVFISWENGNESRASLPELTTVIMLREEE